MRAIRVCIWICTCSHFFHEKDFIDWGLGLGSIYHSLFGGADFSEQLYTTTGKEKTIKLFVAQNGPFGTPFMPQTYPQKIVVWVPFLCCVLSPQMRHMIFFSGEKERGQWRFRTFYANQASELNSLLFLGKRPAFRRKGIYTIPS